MHTDRPDAGDPWPHDMVITIEEDEGALLDLLWVRERYRLDPVGDEVPRDLLVLPELPPTVESLRRDKRIWDRAWPALWATALGRWDRTPGRPVDTTALDDEQVRALLAGPSWRTRFGDTPFDEGYRDWIAELQHRRSARRSTTLAQQPERRSLAALVVAWRRGLTTVVTLPCRGEYARSLGRDTLLLTEEAREDAGSYDRALMSFEPRP